MTRIGLLKDVGSQRRDLGLKSTKPQASFLDTTSMACIHHRKMAQAPALELCHAHHWERKPHCTTSSAPRSTSARMCACGLNTSMVPEDGAYASTTVALRTVHSAGAYAHPPAAGGQPLPLLAQHQAFFATLQPAIQLANPASQSYGSEDVTHPPP